MEIENKLNYEPDFIITSNNQVALSLLNRLLIESNKVSNIKDTNVFTIFKDTIVTLLDITKNKYNGEKHPLFILNKSEGDKIRNDTFDIDNGYFLVIFANFISRLINNDSIASTSNNSHIKAINFLSHSRTNNLTLKHLFNILLSAPFKSNSTPNGVCYLASVDDSAFLSAIYPDVKIIKLSYDLTDMSDTSEITQLFKNSEVKGNNIINIACSQLFSSPLSTTNKIIEFINTPRDDRKTDDITVNSPYKSLEEKSGNIYGNKSISDPDFFISGPPRSGTSLLTVLLSSHPLICIAQDTSVFSEFKKSAIWLDQISQKRFKGNLNFEDEAFDLDRLKYLIDRPYNEDKDQADLLFNLFYTCLTRFHAVDFFVPDPRKDRGTGLNYLYDINFEYILKEVKKKNLPMKSILNYIVNSILKMENNDTNLRGEKTPSHILHSKLLRKTYPNSKFINIIRNPLGYAGSRHQRFDISMAQHCNYYRKNIEHMITNDGQTITIRYEDLIHSPSTTLKEIYEFLEIENHELTENLDPGSYPKYVGKKIDKNRDRNNIDFLTSKMKAEVKDNLKDIFELYYPESL